MKLKKFSLKTPKISKQQPPLKTSSKPSPPSSQLSNSTSNTDHATSPAYQSASPQTSSASSLPNVTSTLNEIPPHAKIHAITLPLPDHKLKPNHRTHWAAKMSAVKEARITAWRIATETLPFPTNIYTPIGYVINYHYKGHRPDADNCLASCKAYLDGIADAYNANDRLWDCYGIHRYHDKKAPRLEITMILTRNATI